MRRLTEAGVEEVRQAGSENLSIRDIARRAGVAAATAYTYFGSKDHLLTEIFWRRLSDITAAFRDPACFSSANGVSLDPAAWGPYAHKTMSFLALDPPWSGTHGAIGPDRTGPSQVTASASNPG